LAVAAADAEDGARAIALLDELIARDASPAIARRALYLKGQLSAASGDWDEVLKSMRQLTEIADDDALRSAAEYWMAEALYRQGQYADAQRQLDHLAETTVDDRAAWLAMIPLRRAQILAHHDQWSDALTLASGIADRFPGFRQQYEVDYLIGRGLARQGRFREARAAYQKVITSPHGGTTETAAMAQWMVGETYFHQQDYQQAATAYLQVELLHEYPYWQAAGLLQAGKCREQQCDHEAAIQLYARLLEQYPHTPLRDDASRRLRIARKRLLNVTSS
jgi:TolA-binding protein